MMLNKPLNRRTFVSTAAKGTTLAAIPASLSAAMYAGGSQGIRIGLVGCGGRGSGACTQALKTEPSARVTAIGDVFTDRLEYSVKNLTRMAKNQFDVRSDHQFAGFDAYQRVIQSGIDVVILAAPPGFRPTHFQAAVDAGVHVSMEKPVAVDGPGIRQILATSELAKQKNLCVQVGFQRRDDVAHMEGVQQLHNGRLGEIQSLEAYWKSAGIWTRARMPSQAEMEYQLRNWYYFVWLSGDFIVEQQSHNLDVCNWIIGTHPVRAETVSAGRTSRLGTNAGEIFDEFITRFTWQTGTSGQDVEALSTARHVKDHPDGYGVGITVQCTGGTAEFGGRTQFKDQSGNVGWRPGSRNNMYEAEWENFWKALKSGLPLNEAQAGAESTLTAIMGRMSGYSGQPVTWDEALNSRESFAPQRLAFDATPPTTPDRFGDYVVPARGRLI